MCEACDVISVCGIMLLRIMGRGENTLIFGSSEARIALGKSVALVKSYVEHATISFICPPPSYQFIL
jgi:hypothetical protein